MSEVKSIVTYQTRKYGVVKIKLAKVMQERSITRNRLRTLTGVKYDVIDRYYKNETVSMADMDFIAKVCYVLDCKIEDILEYEKPQVPDE